MTAEDVVDRATVGNHVTGKLPLATKNVSHQFLVGAAWFGIRSIVGAHHRIGFAFDNCGAKCRQVSFAQVALIRFRVERMTLRPRAAVNGVVLWRGDYLKVTRVIALQSLHKRHSQARGKVRIFAISFLAASPARVAKDIDVRTPECKTLIARMVVVADEFMMLG